MALPVQGKNRAEMRQAIGRKLGLAIVSEVTDTKDTTSLWDTIGLQIGGDDEFNGRQVIIYDAAGSIVDGEKSWVTDYDSTNKDATCTPAFSANLTDGDKYEMWRLLRIEDINDVINEAIESVSARCLQIKETHNNYTSSGIYEYAWLSSFMGLYRVEYVYDVGIEHQLSGCDSAWDELVDGDVTLTADTSLFKEGSGSIKMVAAAGLGAGDIMATTDITSTDISDCDELEIWVYSTVDLTAGYVEVLLDNTASCASAVETLDIPATTANTWTRHVISLANPQSDSAIISVGIQHTTEVGAFTLYVDDIRAVKSTSRVYKTLSPQHWEIVKGSTPYVKFTQAGLSVVGTPTQIRLTGYQLPALLSGDTTDSEIDPSYIEAYSLGNLMLGHAKSSRIDIDDRETKAKFWLGQAEVLKQKIKSAYSGDTRWIK